MKHVCQKSPGVEPANLFSKDLGVQTFDLTQILGDGKRHAMGVSWICNKWFSSVFLNDLKLAPIFVPVYCFAGINILLFS